MFLRIYGFVASCIFLAASGCSTTAPLTSNSELTVTGASELPPPDGFGADSDGIYRIGAFDKLRIDVVGLEDLSIEEAQVDAGGRIYAPLAGVIDAGGKTTEEVARLIEERLRGSHIRNPRVAVNVHETLSQNLTVDGQVTEPGVYPVAPKMTLVSAIARAKGVTEFARLQDVVVFRDVGGRRMAALYNLAAIRRGIYPDPPVYANDTIVVGDSPARRLFRDILQGSSLLAAPLIAVLNTTTQ